MSHSVATKPSTALLVPSTLSEDRSSSIADSNLSHQSNVLPPKDAGVPVLRVVNPPNRFNSQQEVHSDEHHDPHLDHDPERHDIVHAQERPERDMAKLVKKLQWAESTEVLKEDPTELPKPELTLAILQKDEKKEEKKHHLLDWFHKLKAKAKEQKKAQPGKLRRSFTEGLLPRRSTDEDSADPELKPNFFRRLSIVSLSGPEDLAIKQLEDESKAKLKEYKFIKTLGSGAQGVVSLRFHRPTSALCALKSIPTAPSMVDTHVRESYFREIEILKLCRPHPSIIRLLDHWESAHTVYQVFSLMNGGDWASPGILEGVTEERAIRLIGPIADALRFLHDLNILHRDLRPANVFLRRPLTGHESLRELETIPVLADFGISAYAITSGRLGTPFPVTPAHIAPEVVSGARFTKASDCYQLGYYSLHILLHRFPTLEDVQDSDNISDPYWKRMTDVGKETVKNLLNPDPYARWTADAVCEGEWMKTFDVECVKHKIESLTVVEE
ncbi:UNVERIFIED_CONTAM: Checkpoint kinase 2 [Siphonaria sp. JEL0065]|nr:Checkpoint kinase 2 [Siphonaria sp. JEL0065]